MMERLRAILSSTWTRRTVLGLYTTFLVLSIAAYMAVSWQQLQTAVYVRADLPLEKNRPNGLRGIVLDVPTGTFRRDVEVGFVLLDPEPGEQKDTRDGALLGTTKSSANGIFQDAFEIPDGVEAGTYDLAMRVQGESMEPFEAFRRVEVRAGDSGNVDWSEKTSRIANEERRENLESGPVESQDGAIAVDVLPLDGELARGLRNQLYLRTYDPESGAPIPSRVFFEKVEGMGRWGGDESGDAPDRVETDAMGLAELTVNPIGGQRWYLRAEPLNGGNGKKSSPTESVEATGTATLRLHTVATQVSVSVRRPVIEERRRIKGSVHSLFKSGDLLVDLYRGDEWIGAEQLRLGDRRGELNLTVPASEPDDWLYRLQLARGFYDPGKNWESLYLVDAAALDGDGTREALETVVSFVDRHRDDPYFEHLADSKDGPWTRGDPRTRVRWLRAYLAAIPRTFSRPKTLFNTKQADRDKLAAWREDVRSDLMFLIAAGLVGGLAMLLYVVIAGFRRHRDHREDLRDVDAELATESFEEEIDEEQEKKLLEADRTTENLQASLLGIIAFITFAMFAAGVLLVLSHM